MKICLGVLILAVGLACLIQFKVRSTPQSNFQEFFSNLSIGIPEHQSIKYFSQPEDGLTDDHCTTEFEQSDIQFHNFTSKLGVAEKEILSPSGILHFSVIPKFETNYLWFLDIKATNTPEKTYLIHIEGVQFYN